MKTLSRKEAAAQLGLSLRFLDRQLADGSLPYSKIGSRVILQEADVHKLLMRSRVVKRKPQSRKKAR